MSVVVVLCLAFWLTAVMVAARQPGFSRVRSEKMPTGVRGGRHVAVGGRSVGPTRTALVAAAAADLLSASASDAGEAASAIATDGAVAADGTMEATTAVPRPRTDQTRPAEPVVAAEPVAPAAGSPTGVPGPRADQDQQVPQD